MRLSKKYGEPEPSHPPSIFTGVSPCWRSPLVTIAERLAAERGSVLHGRAGTCPFVAGASSHPPNLDRQLIALEHTHAKRIVHRDVKPENLFIDNDGHIVLGDFGLARKIPTGENTIPGDDMFGTPAYIPPEVFIGEPYGCEVDLWAFGVMLYELITGKVGRVAPDIPNKLLILRPGSVQIKHRFPE